MAAPAWRESSAHHSTGANITAVAPTGTAENDLLLAFVFVDVNTPTVTTVGSGYSLVQGPVQGSAGDERCWVYSKLAAASEGNTTWGLSVTNRNWSVILCAISGVDTTTPVNASANRSGTAGTTQAVAQATTTVDDCLIVGFITNDQTSVTPPYYTPPASTLTWTERLDSENTGSNQSFAVATAVKATAGQVPADTWGLGSSDSAPIICIAAAPAGGGVVTGTAAGAFGFTGTAAGVPETFGAAAGTFGFTGAGAGVDRALGAAVAALGFTGAASGVAGAPPVTGVAAAVFGFTGTAAGVDRAVGVAVASLGFAGAATGVDRALGLATAALGFTGASSGVPRTFGAASGTFGFTGASTGRRRVLGVAVAAFGFTGSALGNVGTPPVNGAAAGLFGFTGSAAGTDRALGVAAAAFGFTGAASGRHVVIGLAVASLGFTGVGSGRPRTFGVTSGTLGFTATASGTPRVVGVAIATFGFTGSATGAAPAVQPCPDRTTSVAGKSRAAIIPHQPRNHVVEERP